MLPADFDALVNSTVVATFPTSVVYTTAASNAPATFALNGVFDEAWREVEFKTSRHSGSMSVSTTKPAFGTQVSQFPAGSSPQAGDTLVLNDETYTVSDVRPDGISGWVLLILN
jgi:hypothetical protein